MVLMAAAAVKESKHSEAALHAHMLLKGAQSPKLLAT